MPSFSRGFVHSSGKFGDLLPLIYGHNDKIYADAGLGFGSLMRLDEIGLISFEPINGYVRKSFPQTAVVLFYGKPFEIEFRRSLRTTFL